MEFEKIHRILISEKKEWENAKNIKITKIKGSISNLIYKVSSDNLSSILIRIYGKQMNTLIDRNKEINIFKFVSKNNLSPKLLGLFDLGRFEEYIEGIITLDETNIKEYQNDVIQFMKLLSNSNFKGELICWNRLLEWNYLIKDKKDFTNEIYKLKKDIETYPKNHFLIKTQFCHNDLCPFNILIDKNKKIRFIDYEYAGINYLGCDIANHIIYYDFGNKNRINEHNDAKNFLKNYLNSEPTKLDLEILFKFIKIIYLQWLLWGYASINSYDDDKEFNCQDLIDICYENFKKYL